jgi:ribosomal protein S18 acetylase RimI-like enzyme
MGVDAEERVSYLNCLGPPAEVGALLADLLPELPPGQRLTVPRGTTAHLPAWVSMEGTDWDLRWLGRRPPIQPGEEAVEGVDDDAELRALLAASSPTASALPGDPAVRRWVGIRDGGTLIACAADTSAATGVGHLSSIAVHPAARGRGLGTVVTAALTRQLFDDGSDIVSLGMYADNAYGRAMYDALGFADDHRFTSGPLLVRGRW